MAKIDPLLSAITKFGADGLVLASDSPIALRFAKGDKPAKQTTSHADLVSYIEEIAPPAVVQVLKSGRGGKFDYAAGGVSFNLLVQVQNNLWKIVILIAGKAAATTPAPVAAKPVSATTPVRESTQAPAPPAAAGQPAAARPQRVVMPPGDEIDLDAVAPLDPTYIEESTLKPEDVLLGRLVIHCRFMTMERLAEIANEQVRRGNIRMGALLVEKKILTEEYLVSLLGLQRRLQEKLEAEAKQAAAAAHAAKMAVRDREMAPPTSVNSDLKSWLDNVLRQATSQKASDVLLAPNTPVKLRLAGQLLEHSTVALTPDMAQKVLEGAMRPEIRKRLEADGEVDFAYPLAGVGRFRVNVYRLQTGLGGVFHYIPETPASLTELGMPSHLAKLTNYHQGLVLVTGPAGCGKSSTLAAFVNLINEERNDHILTIEDPVEYKHVMKRCMVNQREVRRDTESFARALRAALREDPDVICIGELRDLETISLALSAAETGHLVLGTLHTNSAIRTINRVVGAYPPNQQSQVRSMLSESLRAVISQRLLPRIDGLGVALAVETLYVTRPVANLIRENKTFQIYSVLQTGRNQGQCLLDQSLLDLVKAGIISPETAASNSEKPEQFKAVAPQAATPGQALA